MRIFCILVCFICLFGTGKASYLLMIDPVLQAKAIGVQSAATKTRNVTRISRGFGIIASPYFGDIYGRRASSKWTFQLDKGGFLRLKLRRLRIFYVKKGKRTCSDSYRLIIDGEKVDCKQFIRKRYPIIYEYQESLVCRETVVGPWMATRCRALHGNFNRTVDIEYFADGSKPLGSHYKTHSPMIGFEISYRYINETAVKSQKEITSFGTPAALLTTQHYTTDELLFAANASESTVATENPVTTSQHVILEPPVPSQPNKLHNDVTDQSYPASPGFELEESDYDAKNASSTNWCHDTNPYVIAGVACTIIVVIAIELRRYWMISKQRKLLNNKMTSLGDGVENAIYFRTLSERVQRHNYEDVLPYVVESTARDDAEPTVQQASISRPAYENITITRPTRHDYDDVAE